MIQIPLKSGKTIDVSDYDALMGTIWVKKIAYRKANIPKEVRRQLRESLIDATNNVD
jgi:hypothetical protein